MTAYRITYTDGSTIERTTHVAPEVLMDSAHLVNGDGRGAVTIARIDIHDADHWNAWPTADAQPNHS